MSRIAVVIALILLSGCSVRECRLEGAYLEAVETGPLVNPTGGDVPLSDPSYDIPPIPEQKTQVKREYLKDNGEVGTDCMDRPPRLNKSGA